MKFKTPKNTRWLKKDVGKTYHVCIVCGKKMTITNNTKFIGLVQGTSILTDDEKQATQGWFPIGNDCAKKLVKH